MYFNYLLNIIFIDFVPVWFSWSNLPINLGLSWW